MRLITLVLLLCASICSAETLTIGQVTSLSLAPGQKLTVVTAASSTALVNRSIGQTPVATVGMTASTTQVFGEYFISQDFRLSAITGSLTYTVAQSTDAVRTGTIDGSIIGGTTPAAATVTALTIAAGGTLDADFAAASATGNDTTQTATITKMAGTITTGALTTAANATTAVVLTLTGVVAGDIVQVTLAGGTNTTSVTINSAIATTDTITVVLRNDVLAVTALNGTVKFHYLWIKA